MFSQEQLKVIETAARKVKNQGELAVVRYLDENPDGRIFDKQQFNIIKYCAEECKRQRSGEMSVYDMVNAWEYAITWKDYGNWDRNFPGQIVIEFIEELGKVVEPDDNRHGFRTIPIGVGDGMGGWIEKAQWERVPSLLQLLIDSYYEGNLGKMEREVFWPDLTKPPYTLALSAEDEFYYEYENIHPFRDGNGRTGKILYNYLNGTLDNPIMPPNFWGGSNP